MSDKSNKIFQPYIFVLLFIGIFLLAFSWFGRHQMFSLFKSKLGPSKFAPFPEQLADAIQSKDVEVYLSHFDPKNQQLRERERAEFAKLSEDVQPGSVEVHCLPRRPGGNNVELIFRIRADRISTSYTYNAKLTKKDGRWLIRSKERVARPDNKAYLIYVKPEEAYSFDRFTIDQTDFYLSVENGALVPGFTAANATAVMIIGNGEIRTPELDGGTDTFNSLFFRVNPGDYPILIKNLKLSPIEEPIEQINQAQYVLDEGIQKSYHANEFAIIPLRDTMTLRVHTEEHGILHYANEGGGFRDVGFGRTKPPQRDSAQMFYRMGVFDYRRGNAQRAEEELSKALKAEPKERWVEAKTRYILGLIYRDRGEKEKAEEEFRKVIEMRTSEYLVDAAEKALLKLERN